MLSVDRTLRNVKRYMSRFMIGVVAQYSSVFTKLIKKKTNGSSSCSTCNSAVLSCTVQLG